MSDTTVRISSTDVPAGIEELNRIHFQVIREMNFWYRPMAPLLPYMLPICFTILAVSLWDWNRQSWPRRVTSISMFLYCYSFDRFEIPLFSLIVAIGYTTWTLLPGSFASVDLPSHDPFMRNLHTLPPNDEGENEECMICWDNGNASAELPCKHKACVGCLKLMGEHCQTACPLCHIGLFCIHDKNIFVLTKLGTSSTTANCALLTLGGIKSVLTGEYWAAISPVSVLLLNGVHFWIVQRSIRASGENWWRGAPEKQSMQLRWVAITAISNGFNVCMSLLNMRDLFD